MKESGGYRIAVLYLACLGLGVVLPLPLTLIGTRLPASVWPRSLNFLLGIVLKVSSVGLFLSLAAVLLYRWLRQAAAVASGARPRTAARTAACAAPCGNGYRVIALADVGAEVAIRLDEGEPVRLELAPAGESGPASIRLIDSAGDCVGTLPPLFAASYIELMEMGKILFAAIRKSEGAYGALELHVSWRPFTGSPGGSEDTYLSKRKESIR